MQTLKYILFALLGGSVLVLALSPEPNWNPTPKIFQFSFLRSLGKTSYALCMFFIHLSMAGSSAVFIMIIGSPLAGNVLAGCGCGPHAGVGSNHLRFLD